MKLCAPVKQLVDSDQVDLQEIDCGTHKTIFEKGRVWATLVDGERHYLPEGKYIASYHDFDKTPDLENVLASLQKAYPQAHFYKIATMAHSTLDSLCMLEFLKRHPHIIGLCMGELGTVTRICSPIFQVPLTYAPLDDGNRTAPGQLLVDHLCQTYHFKSLNPSTHIYGLIGDPVHRSIGHLFHNDLFRTQKRNAVYVKMVVKPHELSDFFQLVKKLPFYGLSVTAPLKEAVIPFVDVLNPKARAIGAVNTLAFREGKTYGYNTDGDAALDVLGKVKGKKIVILGAGGAAKALIYTALQRKAEVTIVNRTLEKAKRLAEQFGCNWNEKFPPYDILINTTSASMPLDATEIIPGKTVMDIALYETEFLKVARTKRCQVLDGFPMFFQQALAQQTIWHN
ncbi:MAG TPA: shikimate dehydrogenase [Candidatus Babeliaceae bacterium]|nr:shikimate dehydrogenase [Candidatus Babeliaceae bacterium]